jgi:hypothetical protein
LLSFVANQQKRSLKSSTLMDKSVPPPNEKTVIGGGVAEQFSSSEFQPLVHELLNELWPPAPRNVGP